MISIWAKEPQMTKSMMIDIEAEVIHGKKIGRTLGFPTANMMFEELETIGRGVYRSKVTIDGTTYKAMSNIGIRPSVGGKEVLLETHIIDYSGDLYGRRLCVTLIEKIRDEKRFASIGDLKKQLQRDYELCRS
jgi:riboflavin kinase/FMN adenylyltransferase